MKTRWSLMIILLGAALLLNSFTVPALIHNDENNPVPPQITRTPGNQATQNAEARNANGVGKLHGKHENYKGVIVTVEENSITIELKDGSLITVSLTEDTRIRIAGNKTASTGDLSAGMQVMTQAIRAADDSLIARAVVCIPGKPEKMHHVGVVTDYLPGESITIQASDEQLYSYSIDGETRILPAGNEEILEPGLTVTIISPRDTDNEILTAVAIVIHSMVNPR